MGGHKMKFARSSLSIAALALCFLGSPSQAEFVPDKTVDIVIHAPPGGSNDVMGRALIAAIEKEKLGGPRCRIVDKTGGGTINAMNYITGQQGNNNVLALFSAAWTGDYIVQKDATNNLQGLTPVANLIFEPALAVVRADS